MADSNDRELNRQARLAKFKKSKTELTLDLKKSSEYGTAREKEKMSLSQMGKRHTQAFIGTKRMNTRTNLYADEPEKAGESGVPMLTKSDEASNVRPGHAPPPHHRQLTRQESTLSRGFKQTKELVRRKTEILVHGSEVEQEKEEDHHKNWTLRRMQTRGKLVSWAMGNVNKEKLEEKLKTSGWSKLRTATRIASQFKNLNPPPTPGSHSYSPTGTNRNLQPSVSINDREIHQLQDPMSRGKNFRQPSRMDSDETTSMMPPTLLQTRHTNLTQTSLPPQNLNKESVAVMGWKVIKATVKGVSVMNQLIPKDDDHEGDVPVFEDPPYMPSLDPADNIPLDLKNVPLTFEPSKNELDLRIPEIPEKNIESEIDLTKTDTGLVLKSDEERPVEEKPQPPIIQAATNRQQAKRGKLGRLVSQVFNRQDKRYPGLGFVQRCMGRARKSRVDSKVKIQLDKWEDHRPFFTWWVSTVQVLVLIFALVDNGFADFGLDIKPYRRTVQERFTEKTLDLEEKTNFYFGPSNQVLIRLGAKYTPCMRRDKQIYDIIDCERNLEKDTACCVNAANRCAQTDAATCGANLYQTRYTYDLIEPADREKFYSGRTSGTVCGLDPIYCDDTHTFWPKGEPLLDSETNEWLDDITQWPVCTLNTTQMVNYQGDVPSVTPKHIQCDIIARPCCIGSEGRCEIVNQAYCDAHNGTFHPDKALCSQVDCMESLCGMLPFISKDNPNQVYRLWLSLFLHAGILHLCLSIFFQMVVLRDLEKLAGWWRIGLIYILSGVVGNLGSAIFVPYRPDVGPSGACFGLIACLFVEFIQSWQLLDQPWYALAKLAVIAVFLFLFGLLPWVDNYAHLFGFISGILLSFALLPYIVFGEFDHGRKFYQAIFAIMIWLALMITLIVLFYNPNPLYLEWAHRFTCVPPIGEAEDFCKLHTHRPERYEEFWNEHNYTTEPKYCQKNEL